MVDFRGVSNIGKTTTGAERHEDGWDGVSLKPRSMAE
jgi:hypothetical protein